MAAAFSSMENGVRLSYRTHQPQPQPQQQQAMERGATVGSRQAAIGRPLQPRVFSARGLGSRVPSPFGRSLLPSPASLLPSTARAGSGSSPFSLSVRSSRNNTSNINSNSNSNSNSNTGNGLWASIMSLGAAALPTSLTSASTTSAAVGALPSPSSSPPSLSPPLPSPLRRGARRNASVAAPGSGSGSGSRARTGRRSLSSLSPSSSSSPGAVLSSTGAAVEVENSRGSHAAGPGPAAGADNSVRAPPLMIRGGTSAPGGAMSNVSNNPDSGGGTEEPAGAATAAATTAATAGSGPVPEGNTAPPALPVYLEENNTVYTCSMCRAHLATRDHIISECFHGHRGRAFLFERCVNVTAGRPEERMLITGMHVVADISCTSCGAELGWKYEEAVEKREKYKEGKFILERFAVTVEGGGGDGRYVSRGRRGANRCGSEARSHSRSVIGWGADNAPFADGGATW